MARAKTSKSAAKRKPASRRSSASARLSGPHNNHGHHLCELVRRREMLEVAKLAKGAKYVCNICGRAAARSGSLCDGVQI
jgi:hypothetical protein